MVMCATISGAYKSGFKLVLINSQIYIYYSICLVFL